MMSQTGKKINLLKNKNNPGLKKFRSETRNVELKNTAAMRPRGFTLVEILLVVMLIGLAAGLAVPNFSGSFSSLQLRETAENLGYLMRYAQSRAIIRRQPCRLEFNIDNTKPWNLRLLKTCLHDIIYSKHDIVVYGLKPKNKFHTYLKHHLFTKKDPIK